MRLSFFHNSDALASGMRAVSGVVSNFIAVVTVSGEWSWGITALAFALAFVTFSLSAFALASAFLEVLGVTFCIPITLTFSWLVPAAFAFALALDYCHQGLLRLRDQRELSTVLYCLLAFWTLHPFYPLAD